MGPYTLSGKNRDHLKKVQDSWLGSEKHISTTA